MAVFTKLTENDFKEILKQYTIGNLISFEGIAEGVENTNYKITTDKDNYIFTVYEKRVKQEDLPFFIELMQKLGQAGMPCPMPIVSNNGELIGKFQDKSFTIVSFLNGKWPKTIGNAEVKEAGYILGKLHSISGNFDSRILSRPNNMDKSFWLETYSKVKDKAEDHFKDLHKYTEQAFKRIESEWPANLPSGIIHADFFPDNVLFHDHKVSGVIDFYMACTDMLAYDLAIAMNAWCFEKDNALNITKTNIMLKAYNDARKLEPEELKYLPLLCIGASLRFLSTRLYDYFNRKDGAVVKVKEPKEYLEKLKFHLQVKSYKEYGL